MTHHINPWGDIEPCPIVQFAKESIHASEADSRSLREKFLESAFLRDFRDLARSSTRGCIVLERPDLLKQLVEKHGARDATVRGTALAELEAMEARTRNTIPAGDSGEKLALSAGQALSGSTISVFTAATITDKRQLPPSCVRKKTFDRSIGSSRCRSEEARPGRSRPRS